LFSTQITQERKRELANITQISPKKKKKKAVPEPSVPQTKAINFFWRSQKEFINSMQEISKKNLHPIRPRQNKATQKKNPHIISNTKLVSTGVMQAEQISMSIATE
jgi:hypothetical protein